MSVWKFRIMLLSSSQIQVNSMYRTGTYSNLSILPRSASLQIIQYGSNSVFVNQTFNLTNRPIRITEDANIYIGAGQNSTYLSPFIGSTYDMRLYLNNLVGLQEFNNYLSGFGCDNNCQLCNEDLTCAICSTGFLVSSAGGCDSVASVTGTVLFNKIDFFNHKVSQYQLPPTTGDFSFFVWMRKKMHSIVPAYNINNLITLYSGGIATTILTETLLQNYTSIYTYPSSTSFSVDYSDKIYHWYQVFVNKTNNVLNVQIIDWRNNFTSVLASIPYYATNVSVAFGDANGQQINTEFALLTAFHQAMTNITFYSSRPKDCDPSCLSCDYITGICRTCKADSSSGITCPLNTIGIKKSYIFSSQDYNNSLLVPNNPQYNILLKDTFQIDVNSLNYSVYGWFSLFNNTALSAGSSYLLFKVSNDDINDQYSSVYSPSRDLIRFEVRFDNSPNGVVPSYYFVVSQLNSSIWIQVSNLAVRANEFVLIHAGVDVVHKKFGYSVYSTIDNSTYSQITNLTNFPERLQEVGTVKLFGVNSILAATNVVPSNGFFYDFNIIVNSGYNASLVDSTKYNNSPNNIKKTLDPNCAIGFSGICFQCNQGLTLQNAVCTSALTTSYVMLTDQTYISENDGSGNSRLTYSVQIDPSVVSTNHGFQVFFRRNYVPSVYGSTSNSILANRKILNYGIIDVSLIANSQTSTMIRIDNEVYPASTIYLGPFDIDNTKDFDWYALLLYFDVANNKTVATLQSSNGAQIAQKYAKYIQNSFTSINFNTLNNEVSLITATQVLNITSLNSSILAFPMVDCQLDCSVCVLNGCRTCDYGFSNNNDRGCNKQSIKPSNVLVQTGSQNTLSFYESLRYGKNARFKDYSLVFSFTMNPSYQYHTIFRIINNNDVSLLKYDTAGINYNMLSLAFDNTTSRFVLSYSNRQIVGTNFTTASVKLNAFPSTSSSQLMVVALSVDNLGQTINVVIYNRFDNIISQTIPFSGLFDNIGIYTNVIFGEDFSKFNGDSALMTIRNIDFSL